MVKIPVKGPDHQNPKIRNITETRGVTIIEDHKMRIGAEMAPTEDTTTVTAMEAVMAAAVIGTGITKVMRKPGTTIEGQDQDLLNEDTIDEMKMMEVAEIEIILNTAGKENEKPHTKDSKRSTTNENWAKRR